MTAGTSTTTQVPPRTAVSAGEGYNGSYIGSFFYSRGYTSSTVFNTVGTILTGAGVAAIAAGEKLKETPLGGALIAGGSVVAAIGLGTLGVGGQVSGTVSEAERFILARQAKIRGHLADEHPAKAFALAEESSKEATKLGLLGEAQNFDDLKKEAVKKLLILGRGSFLSDYAGKPRAELLELLKLLGMGDLDASQELYPQMIEWVSANLLDPNVNLADKLGKLKASEPKIRKLLQELGFIDAVPAHLPEYVGAIVDGGTEEEVRSRLDYLVQQITNGVKFSAVHFFTSDRDLEKVKDKPKETEAGMIRRVWDELRASEKKIGDIKLGEILEGISVFFSKLDALDNEGNLMKPERSAAISHWSYEANPNGDYLFVTDALHRTLWNLKIHGTENCRFDTVGPKASDKETLLTLIKAFGETVSKT